MITLQAAMMHAAVKAERRDREGWCCGLLVSSSISICNVACRLFTYEQKERKAENDGPRLFREHGNPPERASCLAKALQYIHLLAAVAGFVLTNIYFLFPVISLLLLETSV